MNEIPSQDHIVWCVLGMGAIVFFLRVCPFIFANRIVLPSFIRDALELLSPSILTAIIASGVIVKSDKSGLNLSFDNPFLLAAIVILLISLYVRNFLLIMLCGYMSMLLFLFFL